MAPAFFGPSWGMSIARVASTERLAEDRARRMKTLQAVVAIILALAVLVASHAAEAQEAVKVWRIGFLSPFGTSQDKPRLAALQQGLRDLGYVEGKNLVIEQRSAVGRFERLEALAGEPVRLPVHGPVPAGD